MRLIAKKPCSFGGKHFYIGEEVPENLVADSAAQERMGILTIVKTEREEVSAISAGTFTQKQVDDMISSAVAKATESVGDNGIVCISVVGESGKETTVVRTSQEELQKVFSIMQLSATDAIKEIAEVESENVLILIHAADSRSTVQNAAKKQADNLISIDGSKDEAQPGNEATGTKTEGADA